MKEITSNSKLRKMKAFSLLNQQLEQKKSKTARITLLQEYFSSVTPSDQLWAIALFSQKRPKRIITALKLRMLVAETANIPDWLYDECLQISTDQSETNALLITSEENETDQLLTQVIDEIENIRNEPKEIAHERIQEMWTSFEDKERILFNKLITGKFRRNIAPSIIAKALANLLDQEESSFLHRLSDKWSPYETTFERLFLKPHYKDHISTPYSFYYGHPLSEDLGVLGESHHWIAEWKCYGCRAQLIWREGELFLYSRENELLNKQFPELVQMGNHITYDFVIDGEILPFRDGKILSYDVLKSRLSKKKASSKVVDSLPIIFQAFDVLEYRADDARTQPLTERRRLLETISNDIQSKYLSVTPQHMINNWENVKDLLKQSRSHSALGLFLKNIAGPYLEGRHMGDWWKLKAGLLSIKAVLTYAQRSPERGNSKFVDFTFGLWQGEELITFVKTSEGLSEDDYLDLAKFVKSNTLERFGPVFSVIATHVFEIGFEGIMKSKRHKSGIILRRPRIISWHRELPPEQANTLSEIKELL